MAKTAVDRAELFERMPIPKAMAILAVPTILNQLVTTIYNLADTFFVGQLGIPDMVAAVSLCTPAMWILSSLSNLFGMGGGSLISRSLGAGDIGKARRVSAFSNYMCIVIGLVYMGAIFLFPNAIARAMRASPSTIGYVREYLFWAVGVGAVPTILALVMGNLIRAEGSARHEMIGMVTGNVINIILDPILIMGMGMGVTGAAVATMISNVIAVIYYCGYLYFRRGTTVVSLDPQKIRISLAWVKELFSVGLPAALTTLLASLAGMLLNVLAAGHGDTAVAAAGVTKKIDAVPRHVSGGLTQGVLPLIGYNYASKDYRRMFQMRDYALKLVVIFMVVFTLLFLWQAPAFIRLFIDSDEVVGMGASFLRITSICLPMMGVNFMIRSAFQAVGMGREALILSLCRQGLVYAPLLLLFNQLIGLEGLFYAQIVADVVSLGIGLLLYRGFKKYLEQEMSWAGEASARPVEE